MEPRPSATTPLEPARRYERPELEVVSLCCEISAYAPLEGELPLL